MRDMPGEIMTIDLVLTEVEHLIDGDSEIKGLEWDILEHIEYAEKSSGPG